MNNYLIAYIQRYVKNKYGKLFYLLIFLKAMWGSTNINMQFNIYYFHRIIVINYKKSHCSMF